MIKNICSTIIATTISFSVFSQEKVTTTKVVKQQAAFTKKDSMLCKSWKLVALEEFGVSNPPPIEQVKDNFEFKLDKTAVITFLGKTMNGNWYTDKAKTYIYFTDLSNNQKWMFKWFEVTQKELKIEYQNPDLIRTRMNLEAK